MKKKQHTIAVPAVLRHTGTYFAGKAKRNLKKTLMCASIAVILILSFFTAFHYLKFTFIHVAAEDTAETVSASDEADPYMIAEAEPEGAPATDQHYSHMNFALYPDGQWGDKTVTLDGIMPEGASRKRLT